MYTGSEETPEPNDDKTILTVTNADTGAIFRDAMNSHDFIGGFTFGEILKTLSPNEIMDAYDKWKLASKFSVGDQVAVPDPPSYKKYKLGYVTRVKDGVINIIFADGRQAICTANEVTKTGKCVKNIPDLLTFLRALSTDTPL